MDQCEICFASLALPSASHLPSRPKKSRHNFVVSDIENRKKLASTKCGHVFHLDCLTTMQNGTGCPVCGLIFQSKDIREIVIPFVHQIPKILKDLEMLQTVQDKKSRYKARALQLEQEKINLLKEIVMLENVVVLQQNEIEALKANEKRLLEKMEKLRNKGVNDVNEVSRLNAQVQVLEEKLNQNIFNLAWVRWRANQK